MSTYWTPEQRQTLQGALDSARDGKATLLVVEGAAGIGKSSLLDELRRRADGFEIRTAFGLETVDVSYDLLAQWGVGQTQSTEAGSFPFIAAQRLREFVDERAASGPVLLCVDDLHWADRASVQALVWLLCRASGERLLVAAVHRPLGHGRYPEWKRLVGALGQPLQVKRLKLAGLVFADAARIVNDHHPEMAPEAARRLWKHTGGNPLYLTALLSEYGAEALTGDRVLPAPAEFAQVIASRLNRLDAGSVALCRAVAVLGADWISLPDAAAVARISDPGAATQHLVQADLVEFRPTDGHQLRMVHALAQAAVYQQMPRALRTRLHTAAAEVVTEASTVLEHRFAAAEHHDDLLADELAKHAAALYEGHSFTLAARFNRWAGAVSSSPEVRHSRWIESLFCGALGKDRATVMAASPALTRSDDRIGRALVLGCLAVVEGRWPDAVRILGEGDGELDNPLTQYRLQALLTWARLVTGEPTELVAARLRRIRSLAVEDTATSQYVRFATGLAVKHLDDVRARLDGMDELPDRPASAPPRLTTVLAIRGAVSFQRGLLTAAMDDFHEVTSRFESGYRVDFGDNTVQALLGCGYWFRGQWNRADLHLRLSTDMSEDNLSPLIRAFLPLVPAGQGRFDEADRLLTEARGSLVVAPWQSGIQAYLTSQVVRLHAGGDSPAQAALWGDIARQWPRTALTEGVIGPLYLTHVAQAAIWASQFAAAEDVLRLMSAHAPKAPWTAAAVDWLRGLTAERQGDGDAAAELLRRASQGETSGLPLYRAHILADYVRVAARSRPAPDTRAHRRTALELYGSLGAEPYLARWERATAGPEPSGDPERGPGEPYSDRERDVLTLVLAGMSYAQIAKELYITRSTVGYHLSNLYAKTGVRSRHELAGIARRDPQRFGLSRT